MTSPGNADRDPDYVPCSGRASNSSLETPWTAKALYLGVSAARAGLAPHWIRSQPSSNPAQAHPIAEDLSLGYPAV